MKPLQIRYQYLQHFRKVIQQGNYPIGTLAYYGPDDQTITKIVAGVLPDAKTNPILKTWYGKGVAQNPETAADIGAFFQEHETQNIVMPEGVIGCPHQEGVDFPVGESCQECPFWRED